MGNPKELRAGLDPELCLDGRFYRMQLSICEAELGLRLPGGVALTQYRKQFQLAFGQFVQVILEFWAVFLAEDSSQLSARHKPSVK